VCYSVLDSFPRKGAADEAFALDGANSIAGSFQAIQWVTTVLAASATFAKVHWSIENFRDYGTRFAIGNILA
jgi:hypothetical protein